MNKKTINAFWFKKPRPGNFGDILTPLIFSHYGYEVTHSLIEEADYISVGSIAKLATDRHTVLGSGAMTKHAKINPDANWLWVRGPITSEIVVSQGVSRPLLHGDPALLLPRLLPLERNAKHKIGIVPHYVDYDYVCETYPEYRVINLLNADALDVARQITECEKIISSSLHGIIAAHAYGIPAAWVKFSDKLSGDDTKFYDHYESVDLPCELSTVENPEFTIADFDDSEIHNFLESGNF